MLDLLHQFQELHQDCCITQATVSFSTELAEEIYVQPSKDDKLS